MRGSGRAEGTDGVRLPSGERMPCPALLTDASQRLTCVSNFCQAEQPPGFVTLVGPTNHERESDLCPVSLGSSRRVSRARSVPIPQALVSELTSHLASKAGHDFVFTSSRGGPLRHSNFYARHFKSAVHRAGLPPQTRFHDLRHSYTAMLSAEGAHPRAIMERLGHSTIQVTLGAYGHVFPSLEASLTVAPRRRPPIGTTAAPADVRENGPRRLRPHC